MIFYLIVILHPFAQFGAKQCYNIFTKERMIQMIEKATFAGGCFGVWSSHSSSGMVYIK